MSSETRVRAGGVLLMAVALCLIGHQLISSTQTYLSWKIEETAAYELRFGPLRSLLPVDASVDYVSDLTLNGEDYRRGYYNARYVLSPLRLVYRRPCDLAVGNFGDAANVQPILRERGYAIDRDFGNGLYLLRRRAN